LRQNTLKPAEVLFFVYGLVDLAIGTGAVIFSFISGLLSGDIRFFRYFSPEHWAFIALPLVIAGCGFMIVLKAGKRNVFSLFVSAIAIIYLSAAVFAVVPPAFLDHAGVSSDSLFLWKIIIPSAGIVFFLSQAVVSRINRERPDETGTPLL